MPSDRPLTYDVAETIDDPVPGSLDEMPLAPFAVFSSRSADRLYPDSAHSYRSAFQRDRDRVLHSSAFRRLSDKTQVFTGDMGDYHRTRLTHTIEVTCLARTIGRFLRLNEDLIECLAMLHDIGHPPFGHAGEDALNAALVDDGGFSHNWFALTIVQHLEQRYPEHPGLNLTRIVLDCQRSRALKEQANERPILEAQVVDAADSLAYNAHDLDDALQLGLISFDQALEVPLVAEGHDRIVERYGELDEPMARRSLVRQMIDLQVSDVLKASRSALENAKIKSIEDVQRAPTIISSSEEIAEKKGELESFLFQNVYRHPDLTRVRSASQQKLQRMFDHFCAHLDRLPKLYRDRIEDVGKRRAVGDYLAGMTDRYCLQQCVALLD